MRWVELFTRLDGRIGRKSFWIGGGAVLAALYLSNLLATRLAAGLIVFTLLTFPLIAVLVKRLHDRGRSGWWALLLGGPGLAGLAVAFGARMAGAGEVGILTAAKTGILATALVVGAIGVVELGVKPSQPDFNRHGPPPN